TALQASIAAARAARQKAIAAAQEVVEQKQKNIERIQEEVEDLEKQMEKEIETRLAMAGLLVDERLLNELKRELDRANEQVSRAQRRLQRIRDAAGAYGVNILTWEEINAQAQLDLAEARRDQVQDTVDYYDEIQRQADALREQIEAEYEARFEALQQELEAAQAAAEAAQERLREMQKADAARTAAENAQLAAAQAYAQKLAEHAALLSKMLEERMKAEEEAMAAIGEGAPDANRGRGNKAHRL
ncbi:MAG: hypothetical protein GWN76_00255, partial [candidate division Zixibacteria bacterium]|nr:hypothetical protein [candidate division Zixibacteria bacterium]